MIDSKGHSKASKSIVKPDGTIRDEKDNILGYWGTEEQRMKEKFDEEINKIAPPFTTEEQIGHTVQRGRPYYMDRNEMFAFAESFAAQAWALAERKNRDYATEQDPFRNMRRGGAFGIAVRMDDKISRLLNLLKDPSIEPAVKEESIKDSFIDIFNYAWLGPALMEDERG